jgi:tRNA (guanine-N7-)-methyltransferase
MSQHQNRSFERLYPIYGVHGRLHGSAGSGITYHGMDLTSLFPGAGGCEKMIVEVGFGMGEATLELAERYPRTCFLGIEVHLPGVGKVLAEIERRGLENLRIARADASEFLRDHVAEASLDGIHVFFPDPWPKKRHRKRRLVNRDRAGLFARLLKPGGYLYVVTDWEDYARQMLSVLSEQQELENPYTGFAERQDFRPETSFERKGRTQGHEIFEIYLRRVRT